MKNKKTVFLQLLIAIVFCKTAIGQYGTVPLDTCIKQSEYIFEGKIIAVKHFWGTGIYSKNIYASSIYKIDKIFKGDLKCGTVELISLGGAIGNNYQSSESPNMSDSGIAMCYSNAAWPSLHASKENPIALGINGSISYNGNQGMVYNNNDFYPSNKQALYNIFYKALGHRYSSCSLLLEPYQQPLIDNMNNGNTNIKGSSNQLSNSASMGDQNIIVYPNPVTNSVNIKIPNNPVVNVTLYDDSGKAVYKLDNTNNAGIQKIDLSFLKPGIYILRAVTIEDNKMYNFKLDKK